MALYDNELKNKMVSSMQKQNKSITDEKEKNIQTLINQINTKIKQMFKNHHNQVQKYNQEKTFGGKNNKNDKSEKVYIDIAQLQVKIKQGIFKTIKNSEKLRKQRKEYYQNKMAKFVTLLQDLFNKKNIKIKINQNLEKIIQQATAAAQQASQILQKFEKQAKQWCGKPYDLKVPVQKALMTLNEYQFLFENLNKFESITNDSVKQIYLPVQYNEKQFKFLSDSLVKLWPKPIIEKVQVQVQVPVPVVQKVEKETSKLDKAHQLYFGFTRSLQPYKAIKIYEEQAKKPNQNPSALNALGTIYETGTYLKKDFKKAFRYYKQSAKLNDAQGLYKMGYFLEKGLINSKEQFQGRYSNRQTQIRGGIDFYEKAAKLGHLDAMTDLGFIYENGIKDQYGQQIIASFPSTAIDYYKKAKKEQFPRALNNLGSFLVRNSNSVIEQKGQNIDKGIKYLMKAKQYRYPKAFLNLGKCYENGIGVIQNIDMARALFIEGIQAGEQSCRMEYIKTFLGQNIEDDKTMIKLNNICKQVLLQDHSNPEANYFMGLFSQKGIGTEKNKQNSFYYMQKAARRDYAPALVKLGDYYYSGYYVDRNYEFARKLYEKAWEKGNSQALVNLGVMKQKGIGQEERDSSTAHSYYQKAAKMGNVNAFLLLGLKKNPEQQTQNLIKAVELGSIDAVKILAKTQAKLIPKRAKQNTTYENLMRSRATTYCKENNEQKKRNKSFSRSKGQTK